MEGAELLGSLLKKADAVALTTDAATTITLDSIQALTAHWIGDDWELCSAVLGVSELDAEHTAVNVSLLIQALLQAYEFNSNLVCVTNDGAKAQLKASAMLVNAETVSDTLRCFDHTLQLAVTHALEIDEATAILRKCRDAIAVIERSMTFSFNVKESIKLSCMTLVMRNLQRRQQTKTPRLLFVCFAKSVPDGAPRIQWWRGI